MILLHGNSYRTELKVFPKNWKTSKASIKKDWFIYYRLYSCKQSENLKPKKNKLVILKGMNHFKIWQERIVETIKIINQELLRLENIKFADIQITTQTLNNFEIPPQTNFILALRLAEQRITAAPSTKRDLRSTLNFVASSAESLKYSELSIMKITRKHLKHLLYHIDISNGESIHRYNKIRSYLMMIYKELVELETVDSNPLKDISKKKGIQKLRKMPSIKSRQIINQHLQLHHYRFWLFTNIFFHSGARLTEMMQIKRKDVDLDKQSFIITIKKGNIYKEVEKPIKSIALNFWKESLANAKDEDYIFSKGLYPGPSPIQSYQITKRWKLQVKKKLGIQEDFYSLKHLNLDETAELLSLKDASVMASHTSTQITSKYYALFESKRQLERLKSIENPFSK